MDKFPVYSEAGELIGYQDTVGGWLGDAWKGVKKGVKAVGKVARSPALKAVAGGLVLVCPPAGAGLAAGITAAEVANKVAANAQSSNPKIKGAFAALIARTAAASKAGDPQARAGLAMVVNASRAQRGVAPKLTPAQALAAVRKSIKLPGVLRSSKPSPAAAAGAAAGAAAALARARAAGKVPQKTSGPVVEGMVVSRQNGKPVILRGRFVRVG